MTYHCQECGIRFIGENLGERIHPDRVLCPKCYEIEIGLFLQRMARMRERGQ